MSVEHILHKLITFKTVTGNYAEVDRMYAWIRDELQPVPVYIREYVLHGHKALIITPKRVKHARIWLAAHIDVVPAPDALFTPRKRGSILRARGAFDMKFAVACYVALLKELGAKVRDLDIGVMLTSDEELGGHSSVKHLLEKEKFTGEVAFLPDGTGVWEFEEAAKGKWQIEAVTTGVAAHGSRPWMGRSATHELSAYIHDLLAEFESFVTDDPKHWYTTVHVGLMQGGESFNTLAPRATAMLDIRYTDARSRAKIQAILSRLKKKYPHTRIATVHDDPPYGIPRTNGYASEFARIAFERQGITCGWARAHGSSDARFFNRAGIPTILISPRGGDSHSDREWVDIRSLEAYHDVLRTYVTTLAPHARKR